MRVIMVASDLVVSKDLPANSQECVIPPAGYEINSIPVYMGTDYLVVQLHKKNWDF